MDSLSSGKQGITLDWLSRQLHRLAAFDVGDVHKLPEQFLAQKEDLFRVTDRIAAQQSLLSSLTASIVQARVQNFESKSRLNRLVFFADVKRNTYEVLLAGRDGETDEGWEVEETAGNKRRVKLRQDPLSPEIAAAWDEYLAQEAVNLRDERDELHVMLEEDARVREEERELRANNVVSPEAKKQLEKYSDSLSIAMENYLDLRYRLGQCEKIRDVSVKTLRHETAEAMAKIHASTDIQRLKAEQAQNRQAYVERKLAAAHSLELGRLQAKAEALEALVAKEKELINRDKQKLAELVQAAKRNLKISSTAYAEDEFKTVKQLVTDIRGVVRKLEDTANRFKAAARNERLALRE